MQATLERLRQRREETGGEGGFTLIELLIVIVILGILAAIVVFAVQNLSSTSASAACQSDFKTTETAMETYKAQMGNYPSGSSTAGGATAGSLPNTDSDLASINAAGAPSGPGSELLTQTNGVGAVNNATPGGPVGAWLKDIPKNSGHYTIVASNNGTGHVSVQNSAGVPVGNTNSVADCSAI